MFDKLKRLGADTAVYGVSTILGRFLNFLLVPFYTNVLVPQEYGIVTYVFSLLAFANILYSYGIESAYFKFASSPESGDKNENLSTPFLSLLISSTILSLLITSFASPLDSVLGLEGSSSSLVYYAAAILFLDAMAIIPFASLRLQRRARLFGTIKFLNIVVTVLLNIVLLVGLDYGVEGIFFSGVISSAITLVSLLIIVRRRLVPRLNTALLAEMLRFGLPLIPAGFAAIAIQVIDRPILRALTDDATVGIYQANYRLGIIMMLVVSMYDYAWKPFFFSISREPNAKEIFARVLTYLLLAMSFIFLFLTFFIGDIVQLSVFGRAIIHPQYWSGLPVVPIVLLGYLFLGVSTNLSAGILIEKKTYLSAVNTAIGAGVNIAANYLLIPVMGMTGAAWATCLAYFSMAVAAYFMTQRVYPLPIEFTRISKIGLATLSSLTLYYVPSPQVHPVLYKLTLLALFVVLMWVLRFMEPGEKERVKKLFTRGAIGKG